MILAQREDEVLIDLDDFTIITKSLGIKFERKTWYNHTKKGWIDIGSYKDGKCFFWISVAIYNAFFDEKISCSKCNELTATLKNINLLTNDCC